MIYHISWLELAIKKFKECYDVHAIGGDMTIEEFIKAFQQEELDKVIKLEQEEV